MSLSNLIIRPETPRDTDAITAVTIAAFKTLAISEHTEQFIIAHLRAANALTLSLVAELENRVVGHIAFSPVSISDGTPNWYGLGPVSVLPTLHRQGIGTALIQNGLSQLQQKNPHGCCLVGHPSYYPRFGFKTIPGFLYADAPPEVFLALPFTNHIPRGTVHFHPAFYATSNPT